MPEWQKVDAANLSDLEYQANILQGVSRTFALTIPQLPCRLHKVVGNAYLLCRIADTIEDEVSLAPDQKRHFSRMFIDVVTGRVPASAFAGELHPLLSARTPVAERDLIKNTPRVIRLTHGFTETQRAAIGRCVAIMAKGMAAFQAAPNPDGLNDIPQLDQYCYYVAGVVGEMLTELLCEYSEAIRTRRKEMIELAVSFGQGLQMTNILKDVWEDRSRGACWLPRDVFSECGFDLASLSKEHHGGPFGEGLERLIGLARAHLGNALSYTLMIPRRERGIRKFCLLALGMALLTLRKIHRNRSFTAGEQVKISRRAVKATVIAAEIAAGNDWMLRLLFRAAAAGLPRPPVLAGVTPCPLQSHAFRESELN